jgi:glutamine synthetase
MLLFAPNPNSYRRFKAGAFAPAGPSWGYDHREVALRVPRASEDNRRIEHRIAGADANPYLVLAAVLAGMHAGMQRKRDPGEPVRREADLSEEETTLPTRLDAAIANFSKRAIFCRTTWARSPTPTRRYARERATTTTVRCRTSTTSGSCELFRLQGSHSGKPLRK